MEQFSLAARSHPNEIRFSISFKWTHAIIQKIDPAENKRITTHYCWTECFSFLILMQQTDMRVALLSISICGNMRRVPFLSSTSTSTFYGHFDIHCRYSLCCSIVDVCNEFKQNRIQIQLSFFSAYRIDLFRMNEIYIEYAHAQIIIIIIAQTQPANSTITKKKQWKRNHKGTHYNNNNIRANWQLFFSKNVNKFSLFRIINKWRIRRRIERMRENFWRGKEFHLNKSKQTFVWNNIIFGFRSIFSIRFSVRLCRSCLFSCVLINQSMQTNTLRDTRYRLPVHFSFIFAAIIFIWSHQTKCVNITTYVCIFYYYEYYYYYYYVIHITNHPTYVLQSELSNAYSRRRDRHSHITN